jgi:hypothetical protein
MTILTCLIAVALSIYAGARFGRTLLGQILFGMGAYIVTMFVFVSMIYGIGNVIAVLMLFSVCSFNPQCLS